MCGEYSARAEIKRVNEAYQTKEQIQQNYIMAEWRQASSFQASLLVLVPSGGGVTWGEMRVWRAPLPGVQSRAAPRKGIASLECGKCVDLDFGPKETRVYGRSRTLETRAGHAIRSAWSWELEREGECTPPKRNEWKNMSMEHKEGVCE